MFYEKRDRISGHNSFPSRMNFVNHCSYILAMAVGCGTVVALPPKRAESMRSLRIRSLVLTVVEVAWLVVEEVCDWEV